MAQQLSKSKEAADDKRDNKVYNKVGSGTQESVKIPS